MERIITIPIKNSLQEEVANNQINTNENNTNEGEPETLVKTIVIPTKNTNNYGGGIIKDPLEDYVEVDYNNLKFLTGQWIKYQWRFAPLLALRGFASQGYHLQDDYFKEVKGGFLHKIIPGNTALIEGYITLRIPGTSEKIEVSLKEHVFYAKYDTPNYLALQEILEERNKLNHLKKQLARRKLL